MKNTTPTVLLVVDDEAQVLELERRILETAGYQVMQASHGLEAIARLADGTPLDLLIADLNMPGLDGMEMVIGPLVFASLILPRLMPRLFHRDRRRR